MRQWHYDIINCAPPLFKPSGSTRGKQHTRSRRGDKGGPPQFYAEKKNKNQNISQHKSVVIWSPFSSRLGHEDILSQPCTAPVRPSGLFINPMEILSPHSETQQFRLVCACGKCATLTKVCISTPTWSFLNPNHELFVPKPRHTSTTVLK